jgi:hypothetical protein
MNGFYALLKNWYRKKEYTSILLTKKDYDTIVNYLLLLKQGDTDCRTGYLSGNYNAYKWAKRYHVFTFGVQSAVLVLRPDSTKGAVDVTAMSLDSLSQPTYAERLFSDLWKIHKVL